MNEFVFFTIFFIQFCVTFTPSFSNANANPIDANTCAVGLNHENFPNDKECKKCFQEIPECFGMTPRADLRRQFKPVIELSKLPSHYNSLLRSCFFFSNLMNLGTYKIKRLFIIFFFYFCFFLKWAFQGPSFSR